MCGQSLHGGASVGSRASRAHARLDEAASYVWVRCEMKMDVAHKRPPDEVALCALSAATSTDPIGPRHRVGDRVQRGIVELVATGGGASAADRTITAKHHVGVAQREPARPHVDGGR